jgi:hypothetical protein
VPSPPGNGFPFWYQDLNGLVLDQCLTDATDPGALQQTACLLTTPPPYTFPTLFPPEMFYFRAVSDRLFTSSTKFGILVLALEGSFATGAVQAGQQMVFTRIRVTAGVPFPGTYTINHPYGTDVQIVDSVAAGNRDIFYTIDVGLTPGVFTDALTSRVGPFLQASPFSPGGLPALPVTLNGAQFIGDGVTLTHVTGSPFQDPNPANIANPGPGNWFEMCGPFDGPASPDRCIRQELFTLTGRLHNFATSPIGSPLSVERATYSRAVDNSVTIDVSATAIPGVGQAPPTLSVGGQGVPPVLMAGPDDPRKGHFYARGVPSPADVLSTQIAVTNSADAPPTSVTTRLIDEVAVSQASYDAGALTLTVVATGSDKAVSALTLDGFPSATVAGCGTADPACVSFTASGIIIPPPHVVVSSAAGGRGVLDVTMAGSAVFGPGAVYAQDDSAATTAGAAMSAIDVLFNDTVNAAASAQTLSIVTGPTLGSAVVDTLALKINYTPPAVTAGTTTFTYTVGNAVGQSNVATVTVTIGPSANPVPTAVADSAAVTAGSSVVINVLANDLDNDGNPAVNLLNPASVTITAPPATGTASVNTTTGTITYTSPANAATGTVTFAYTVKNTNGNTSNAATVSVAVTAGETLTVKAPAKCNNPNNWDMNGTSSNLTGTVTIYNTATVPASPLANQVVATNVPIAAGKWQFRGASVAGCSPSMSLKSGTGTRLENVAVQVR